MTLKVCCFFLVQHEIKLPTTQIFLSVMFYYSVRDVGLIHELISFMESGRPSEQTKDALLQQFPDFTEFAADMRLMALDNDTSDRLVLSFPHLIVAVMGHAGSGKTHILKHLANRPRTMFYAPTNPAGINLQSTLYPAILFPSAKKKVYRTIHNFFQIKPEDSNILGQQIFKVRQKQNVSTSYDEYCLTMYRACKPFCEKLFSKELDSGKISPETYQEHADAIRQSNGFRKGDYQHEKVIEHLCSVGLGSKIPSILLYDVSILEEAGRTADYLGFLFLFYYYFMHIKYRTYAWRQTIPVLMFVGSVTQSRVIDEYTEYSALTFLGQPCVKSYLRDSHGIKIKSFKDNRRVTTGNIENNTTLSSCVNRLELGRVVNQTLKEKFNSAFVTDEKNFFDPMFKPDFFRIAKTHAHLKTFKTNVFRLNDHNTRSVSEHFLTTVDEPAFSKLEGHINVKFRSETYEDVWKNTKTTTKLFDNDFIVYKTSRTLLEGFRYLLTEYHSLYIGSFKGTVDQFVELTDLLQCYIANDRSNCIPFFVNCAKYLIEDIYSNQVENVVKSLNEEMSSDESLEALLAMKSLLRQTSGRKKELIYANEQAGLNIVLPKDVFSFILSSVEVRKPRGENELESVCLSLILDSCLHLKMFPKLKSVSTFEVTNMIQQDCKPDFGKFQTVESGHRGMKRSREVMESGEENEVELLEEVDEMSLLMQRNDHKSFFRFVPLVLHICSTIDATQGLTIHSPILALLTRKDKAEDIIVALTRSSNPDNLLVANRVFDSAYSPIAPEIQSLVRLVNEVQKQGGWL